MSTGVDIPVLPPVAAAPRGSDRALRACCVVFIAAISAWSSLLSGGGGNAERVSDTGDRMPWEGNRWGNEGRVSCPVFSGSVSGHRSPVSVLWLIAVVWCVYVPAWLIWTRRWWGVLIVLLSLLAWLLLAAGSAAAGWVLRMMAR